MKYATERPEAVFDTECFANYWSIGFQSEADGRRRVFEMYEGHPLDRTAIAEIFRKWRVKGFNSRNYDIPMTLYAMAGATNGELKQLNDKIIVGGAKWWHVLDALNLSVPEFFDVIDLQEVSPGAPTRPSLKLLGGRLHCKRMQEMPVEVDEWITPASREVIRSYHGNDLDVSADLSRDLKEQLRLRAVMSDEYGVDLRSKSDPQVAEAIVRVEMEKLLGRRLYAPDIVPGLLAYTPPPFIQFVTPQMNEVLRIVTTARFLVDHKGVVNMPEVVKKLKIVLGGGVYQMGIGGLHSTESCVSHYSSEWETLLDRDVTSFYPFVILMLQLYPAQFGPRFLNVYKRIVDRRVAAKAAGNKNVAETLKIVLNGLFGKFGSPFACVYSPTTMIQITITGQLALLMQIEALELAGIPVISANTDGVVAKVPNEKLDDYRAIYARWEKQTGFTTEETMYESLHSRDVNNYIAIKKGKDGKKEAKLKGAFTPCGPGLAGAAGQKKNPDAEVSVDAAVAYLIHGIPLEDTIDFEMDFRKFLTVRRVTGGANNGDGDYVGKTIRWYYAKGVTTGFTRADNGNKVSDSIGAKPCMELPATMPRDIDFDWYIREAYGILQDVGLPAIDPRLMHRTDVFKGRKPDQVTYHLIDATTGVALCGAYRKSVRSSWVERRHLSEGERLCSKCKKVHTTEDEE